MPASSRVYIGRRVREVQTVKSDPLSRGNRTDSRRPRCVGRDDVRTMRFETRSGPPEFARFQVPRESVPTQRSHSERGSESAGGSEIAVLRTIIAIIELPEVATAKVTATDRQSDPTLAWDHVRRGPGPEIEQPLNKAPARAAVGISLAARTLYRTRRFKTAEPVGGITPVSIQSEPDNQQTEAQADVLHVGDPCDGWRNGFRIRDQLIPNLKSQISNLKFQISSLRFHISHFKCEISNLRFQISIRLAAVISDSRRYPESFHQPRIASDRFDARSQTTDPPSMSSRPLFAGN